MTPVYKPWSSAIWVQGPTTRSLGNEFFLWLLITYKSWDDTTSSFIPHLYLLRARKLTMTKLPLGWGFPPRFGGEKEGKESIPQSRNSLGIVPYTLEDVFEFR